MSKNYILPKLMGGLGNNLFQVSTALSYANSFNKELLIDYRDVQTAHKNLKDYTSNIFRNLPFTKFDGSFNQYNEKSFHFSEIPYYNGNLKLSGYFQSEKYFKKTKNIILECFNMTDETKNKLYDLYGEELNVKPISIHVRRGDYIKLQEYHPVLPLSYYIDSINYFGVEKQYIIFSDDIDWCKENLDFIKNKIFVDSIEDYEQLYLMSLCTHNINANSSFSWWGSWMNQNEHKVVIFPKTWFGPKYRLYNLSDLYYDKTIKF